MNAVKSSNTRKFVYSTGGNRGTLFDAFINSNSKPHMVDKLSKSVFASSETVLPEAKSIFEKLCDGLGEFNIRQKSLGKLKTKIPKAFNELSLEEAGELIYKGQIRDLIGDGCGTRIILNNTGSRKELVSRLVDAHKAGKITIQKIENYHGKGINPYFDEDDLKLFQELDFIGTYGNKQSVQIINKVKDAGYTRVNMDVLVNGSRAEFQVGGKNTTRFGEVEHYLYDMRGKGTVNLSNLSENQKKLFYKMKESYVKIMRNPVLKEKYNDYLTNVWKVLKDAESLNIKPKLPELPEGMPKILSAVNLLKLEKNAL